MFSQMRLSRCEARRGSARRGLASYSQRNAVLTPSLPPFTEQFMLTLEDTVATTHNDQRDLAERTDAYCCKSIEPASTPIASHTTT